MHSWILEDSLGSRSHGTMKFVQTRDKNSRNITDFLSKCSKTLSTCAKNYLNKSYTVYKIIRDECNIIYCLQNYESSMYQLSSAQSFPKVWEDSCSLLALYNKKRLSWFAFELLQQKLSLCLFKLEETRPNFP